MRANRGLSDPIGQQVRWGWRRAGGGEGGIYIISIHIRQGSDLGAGKRRGGVFEIYLISSQSRCRGELPEWRPASGRCDAVFRKLTVHIIFARIVGRKTLCLQCGLY